MAKRLIIGTMVNNNQKQGKIVGIKHSPRFGTQYLVQYAASRVWEVMGTITNFYASDLVDDQPGGGSVMTFYYNDETGEILGEGILYDAEVLEDLPVITCRRLAELANQKNYEDWLGARKSLVEEGLYLSEWDKEGPGKTWKPQAQPQPEG